MIHDLLTFCDGQFHRDGRCSSCTNSCQGGCEQCLDAIHFSRIDRPYNCPNIAYFYTCKYSYKYSSEIDRLISRLQSLKTYNSFDVLSIGCGPCTEFLGLYRCLDRAGFNKSVNYVAFEMNPIWKPIHSFYNNYSFSGHQITMRYSYTDACKVIPKLDLAKAAWRPNLLFLQYVISDMVKAGMDATLFLDNLLQTVILKMPVDSYVIVNDINHNRKARDWFDYLEGKFCERYITWKYKGHFQNEHGKGYPYGNLHPTNSLTCRISHSVDLKYNPWKTCSSAHLVLKKLGDK